MYVLTKSSWVGYGLVNVFQTMEGKISIWEHRKKEEESFLTTDDEGSTNNIHAKTLWAVKCDHSWLNYCTACYVHANMATCGSEVKSISYQRISCSQRHIMR